MRKLLGTLKIYIDDDESSNESSYTHSVMDSDLTEIILRPKADMRLNESGKDTRGVLAHELGHFVNHLFKTQAAENSGWPWSSWREQYTAEVEAWDIAEKIVPEVKKTKVAELPLQEYKKIADKCGDIPKALCR